MHVRAFPHGFEGFNESRRELRKGSGLGPSEAGRRQQLGERAIRAEGAFATILECGAVVTETEGLSMDQWRVATISGDGR